MSDLILPAGVVEELKAKQLPEPKGWVILAMVPNVEQTYAGSELLKADKTIEVEATLTTVLFVLRLGPDCYLDKNKFPSGAYCKEGDFIMVAPFAGQKFSMYGYNLRLITDDSVLAVVQDPRAVIRK